MLKLTPLLLLLPLLAFTSPPDTCGGVLRWDYKICIDTAGLRVLFIPAKSKSISSLNNIIRPANSQLGNKRAEAEKQKVSVTAYVIECGKETDKDYHLVLKGITTNDTLIAEIPDPVCPKVAGFPHLVDKYTKARRFVLDSIDPTPGAIASLATPVKVRVTGILFFDKMAHGNGHARNGIEIHPILEIRKVN
jgi:hypothetical protein